MRNDLMSAMGLNHPKTANADKLRKLIEEMEVRLAAAEAEETERMISGEHLDKVPTSRKKKTAKVEAHVEPEVKKQAEAILKSLGIPMSHAINIYLRQIINNQGIPFEIKA